MDHIMDPVDEVIIIPYKRGLVSDAESSFILEIGERVDEYESPEFEVPRANITLKLVVKKKHHCHCQLFDIQFLLMRPENDIIEVMIKSTKRQKAVLTPDDRSFTFDSIPQSKRFCSSGSGVVYKYKFVFSKFRRSGNPVIDLNPSVALIGVDGEEVRVRADLLKRVSALFAQQVDAGAEVLLFENVHRSNLKLLKHFVHTGYCSGWYKEWDRLSAIADRYNIVAMKELADKKKTLIQTVDPDWQPHTS